MGIVIINTDKNPEGKSAINLQAALERLLGSGIPLLRYDDDKMLNAIKAASPGALVFSGQGTPWWLYSEEELAAVYGLIRSAKYPMLGICGGHQLIAKAFGATVGPMRAICEEPSETSYDGYWRERGMVNVRLVGQDAIFDGLPRTVVMWQNHCEEVKEVPQGFILLATGSDCRIQMIRHREALIYGTAFHPERANDEHADGWRLLENFFALSGVSSRPALGGQNSGRMS